MYFIKTPRWLPALFHPQLIWHRRVPGSPAVYLTFDDGPHPVATPFVLEQLKAAGAKATFFCIGKNVVAHPDLYRQTMAEGHAVGNHTQQHLNGWKTTPDAYLADVLVARQSISSNLFRPPYGRIRRSQVQLLLRQDPAFRIVMWDVLSADFDTGITPQQCLENVLRHLQPGAIVVFHDSAKAWDRLRFALPAVLAHCSAQGWACQSL